MTKLIREKSNRLLLVESSITDNLYDVTLSVFNEAGEYVKDNAGNDIDDRAASWEAVGKYYYLDIQFAADTIIGYLRIFWTANLKTTGVTYELSDVNTPQEVELITSGTDEGTVPQIVPISFFLDNFIAKDLRMDGQYKRAVETYVASNRRDINRWLLASQGNLQLSLKTVFFTKTDSIARDYYMQDFGSEFWINQANFRPIVSIQSYALRYGSQNLDITKNIAEYILVDKLAGTFEFLPTAIQGNLFTALINGVSGLGISIMNSGSFNRIPFLFRIDYTYGLDFLNLDSDEKESIRQAICKNTAMRILPIIDPSVRITSDSKSIDGVNKSQNSGMAALLKTYGEEEAKWINEMMRKYALHFDMGVV